MTQVNAAGAAIIAISVLSCASAALAADAPAATMAAPNLGSALTDGKWHLDFRYRYENVEQDGFTDDAYASTLRTKVSYTTLAWKGLSASVEGANLLVLGNYDAYNSTRNDVTDRPVVADPTFTAVHQAWLQYTLGSFTGIGGRQIINLDDQRFVGNVGWRQNDQTFDAVTLKLGALPHTQLFYSWVGAVNRIYGPPDGTFPGRLMGNTSLLNARVDLGPIGQLALFDYWLDFDHDKCCVAARSNNLSNNSYGFRYTGTHKFSDAWKMNWAGSWAHQTDFGQSTLNYSADYYLIEGGAGFRNFGLKIGYEVLGGNKPGTVTKATPGFQTPLATLHAFQGWADMFLTTPTTGVDDLYVAGSATFGGLTAQVIYHDFQADAVSTNFGTEWDASVAYKFSSRYEALLKYADYRSDRDAAGTPQGLDTTKTWVQFVASF